MYNILKIPLLCSPGVTIVIVYVIPYGDCVTFQIINEQCLDTKVCVCVWLCSSTILHNIYNIGPYLSIFFIYLL